MAKYLLKIEFDCNDADYVYGCQIIDEKLKKTIDENGNRLVMFGAYDFSGGNERAINDCMEYVKITDEESATLKKFGLHKFGEQWDGEFGDEESDDEDIDDDDDEDYEDDEVMVDLTEEFELNTNFSVEDNIHDFMKENLRDYFEFNTWDEPEETSLVFSYDDIKYRVSIEEDGCIEASHDGRIMDWKVSVIHLMN